jgi:hypothetical protein
MMLKPYVSTRLAQEHLHGELDYSLKQATCLRICAQTGAGSRTLEGATALEDFENTLRIFYVYIVMPSFSALGHLQVIVILHLDLQRGIFSSTPGPKIMLMKLFCTYKLCILLSCNQRIRPLLII